MVFDPKSKPACWYHVGVSGSVKEEDLIPLNGATTYLLDKSCLLPEDFYGNQTGPGPENGFPKSDEKGHLVL